MKLPDFYAIKMLSSYYPEDSEELEHLKLLASNERRKAKRAFCVRSDQRFYKKRLKKIAQQWDVSVDWLFENIGARRLGKLKRAKRLYKGEHAEWYEWCCMYKTHRDAAITKEAVKSWYRDEDTIEE